MFFFSSFQCSLANFVLTFFQIMEKFLILGGESSLARCFLKYYGKECKALSKKGCDITDLKILESVIKNSKCEYVINCAAITDIQFSEKNPEKCFEINSIAVNNVGKFCDKYNKKFIHFSSDYAVNPVNIYGYSKFISEKVLTLKKDLIIRTSFYSQDYFVIKSLLQGNKTLVYKNVFFNPVSINRLVLEIYKNKDKVGILNIFTDKKISKYNFGSKIAKILKIDKKLLKPVNFKNKLSEVILPLNSFVKSDIKISLDEDLLSFKKSSDFLLRH